MTAILMTTTLLSIFLIIYHHLIYPLLMLLLHQRLANNELRVKPRQYSNNEHDKNLPSVCVVMPAFNEQQWIAEKIRNLAALDYPADRLKVIIACDGCTDNTAHLAEQTCLEMECRHLDISINVFQRNQGKVATINAVIEDLNCELVMLSDVSALISVDALLITAEHFKNAEVGVLNSHYQLLHPGSIGEANYWKYQSQLKQGEASLGSTLGAHGACYIFRRSLFAALPSDTINDDFILPMEIVARGYRAIQDKRINALEMEQADTSMDQQRRRRIAAGNMQQLLRLKKLLQPKYRGVAFTFASGKCLRVLMPTLMLIALLGSCILAFNDLLFALIAALQLIAYGLACYPLILNKKKHSRYLASLSYLVSGHIANFIGGYRYIFGLENGRWTSIRTENLTSPTGDKK